jgi:hypothetical protein
VGDDTLFLEVQPWAILCGAADEAMGRQLLATIDERLRHGSALGARQHWPLAAKEPFPNGEALSGGIWFSLLQPLIWAASRLCPDLAVDEWRRFSLANHAIAYPTTWEGTLSGPDAYNAPESARPGRTWGACQAYPVNNPHAHAQPLMAYLRLLGVEPDSHGALCVGGGPGAFESRTFGLDESGAGWLTALGPVTVRSPFGEAQGGPGDVAWGQAPILPESDVRRSEKGR